MRVRLVALILCTVHAVGALAAERIYVTNEMSGDLSVIDGQTERIVATLKLGKRPRGLKTSPTGKLLFVALSGSPVIPPGADEKNAPPADKTADGIGVVDLSTQRLLKVIRGVSDPEQLAVSRDGSRLFVASEDTGKLHVIDIASEKTLATLPVGGEPEGVTLSPNGKTVCVTSEEDALVTLIDTATNAPVAQIGVGKRPRYCEFSIDGSRAFVSGELDASVSVIDIRLRKVVHTVQLSGENVRPMGMAIAPDGAMLYVATGRGGTVVAVDAHSYKLGRSVAVGPRPWNVAINKKGTKLFTANGSSNDISVVDVQTMAVLKKIQVGERPWGVVIR